MIDILVSCCATHEVFCLWVLVHAAVIPVRGTGNRLLGDERLHGPAPRSIGEQRWYLQIVADRRMRSDYTARMEIVVHTAPAG